MVAAQPETGQIWEWLKAVSDPEIPVLSVVDLGIVRDVEWSADGTELSITITPTYCGCPAMDAIALDIRSMLARHGIERVSITHRLSPAWTTDWLGEEAKNRLREFGIAPPPKGAIDVSQIEPLHAPQPNAVFCPRCGSKRTKLLSRFGSTACKAQYKCLECLEPFDAFKQH